MSTQVLSNTLGVKLSIITKNIIKNYNTIKDVWLREETSEQKDRSAQLKQNGLLYYKISKDGVVTNFQTWLRGWKEHKITEYDMRMGRRNCGYNGLMTQSKNAKVWALWSQTI